MSEEEGKVEEQIINMRIPVLILLAGYVLGRELETYEMSRKSLCVAIIISLVRLPN